MRPIATVRLHEQAALVPEHSAAEYAALRSSIAEHGIRVPLDVTDDGVVLDGRARLRAAAELGHEQVPVRVVDPEDDVAYMVLAAIERRHLSESQRAALVVKHADLEAMRAEGQARSRANLRQRGAEVATLPPRGKMRDRLAALARTSGRTVQHAMSVLEHDPVLLERVIAGDIEVFPAARRVQRALRDAGLPPAPPLPRGPFEVVLADPAWQMGSPDSPSAPEQHYPTMPLEEIKALEVPAAEDAVLFLWAVNGLLPAAVGVMEAWGFTYKAQLVWVKDRPGTGNWVRNQHELLLIGRKGSFPTPDPEDRVASVITAKRGRHSQKPTSVYEAIERMYPLASKVELFARGKPRPGWVFWGNEVEADDSATPAAEEER